MCLVSTSLSLASQPSNRSSNCIQPLRARTAETKDVSCTLHALTAAHLHRLPPNHQGHLNMSSDAPTPLFLFLSLLGRRLLHVLTVRARLDRSPAWHGPASPGSPHIVPNTIPTGHTSTVYTFISLIGQPNQSKAAKANHSKKSPSEDHHAGRVEAGSGVVEQAHREATQICKLLWYSKRKRQYRQTREERKRSCPA